MSSVSITNVRDGSQDGRVQTWKTPWMAQREKMAAGPTAAETAARATKFAADAVKAKQRAELSAPAPADDRAAGVRGAHGAVARAAPGPRARAGLSGRRARGSCVALQAFARALSVIRCLAVLPDAGSAAPVRLLQRRVQRPQPHHARARDSGRAVRHEPADPLSRADAKACDPAHADRARGVLWLCDRHGRRGYCSGVLYADLVAVPGADRVSYPRHVAAIPRISPHDAQDLRVRRFRDRGCTAWCSTSVRRHGTRSGCCSPG